MTVNSMLPGTKWTVPVGGGVAKTFKYNDQLMSVGLLYYTNVVRAAGSPQTTLRVSWSLLWPVKRGIDIQQLLQEAKNYRRATYPTTAPPRIKYTGLIFVRMTNANVMTPTTSVSHPVIAVLPNDIIPPTARPIATGARPF